jgi:sulfate adenylyltransferase large subunit
VQYTRNMATGASTADVAVVVIDATAGLREQTRRHCCIAALLGVRHLVVTVNKMDLTDWDRDAFVDVDRAMRSLAQRLGIETVVAIPISALHGDNVAEPSVHAPWYEGPTVLDALEDAPASVWTAGDGAGARLPVQWVVRHPDGGRSYAGMVTGGTLRPGDEIVVLPDGRRSTIASVSTFDGPLGEARPALSVTISLADDLDVARGDLIAAVDGAPPTRHELDATVCWFGREQLRAGQRFRVKHTTRVTPARVLAVQSRLDLGSLALVEADRLDDNDIGVARLAMGTALAADPYRINRVTGSFVIIDETTNATVAAGMVGAPTLAAATG